MPPDLLSSSGDLDGGTHESAWLDLYRTTVPALYRRLSRRTGGDRELTEDLTQEAWLRLLAAHADSEAPTEPLAWLTTTATNLLRNYFRRAQPLSLGGGAFDLDAPENVAEDASTAALVQWGLARLKPRQASLLEAHYLDGRSLADIAGELDTSARAIEGRLRRARQVLERLLAPHIDGIPS